MNISTIFSDKLEELVLYLVRASDNDPGLMSTKLNKLVWACDFAAFCNTGRTITGASYQREKYGPVPKAMPIILERLEREGRIELQPVKVGRNDGVRYKALKAADVSSFSPETLATVLKVITENFHKTGTAMSKELHNRLMWKVSKNGDPMPFAGWFVSERKPTEAEKRTGIRLEGSAKAFHARS